MKRHELFIKFSRGFTLMETIVVVAIVSVIMLAVVDLFTHFNNSYTIQNATISGAYSASAFLNETERLTLQANAIVASKTVNSIAYTTGTSTLILEIPSIDSSDNIIANTYDYAVLYHSSTTVTRIISANASSARISGTKVLGDVVSSLSFTYDNVNPALATKVTIDITTSSQVKLETVQTHLTQQVYLRNN